MNRAAAAAFVARRANFEIRQAGILASDVAYNISPEATFSTYAFIGRTGTFVTDESGAFGTVGSASSAQYEMGLFSRYDMSIFATNHQISYLRAWQIERAFGLERRRLAGGFRVTRIEGISGMHPRTPLAGNDYFLGPGMGLPNEAPELVIDSVPTSPWPPR